jgi:hypothetical protein
MEWVFFAGGAVTLIAIKLFVSWLGLLMKLEVQRREIVALKKAAEGERDHRFQSYAFTVRTTTADREDQKLDNWPDVIE